MTESVTIELPKPLAKKARTSGLLASASVEQMLRRELSRKAFVRALALRRLPGRPPTESEIESEIAAVRATRRRK